MCSVSCGVERTTLFFERAGVRYRMLRWSAASGEVEASSTAAPLQLVMLHGFSQSALTWDEVAAFLVEAHPRCAIWAPEFVGHGGSDVPHDPAPYAFDELVEALAFAIDEVVLGRVGEPGIGVGTDSSRTGEHSGMGNGGQMDHRVGSDRIALIGYSMGGRVALAYAHARPERLHSLVLESAGLGPSDEDARREAADRNAVLALRLRTSTLDDFMDFWETRPVFASQFGLPAVKRELLREARMANDSEALALTFEGSGVHTMPDLSRVPGDLATRGVPVLYLAGELDPKYAALARLLPETTAGARGGEGAGYRMRPVVRVVLGVGHDVHFEDPVSFVREVEALIWH